MFVFTTCLVYCVKKARKEKLEKQNALAKENFEQRYSGRSLPGPDGEFIFLDPERKKARVDYSAFSGFSIDAE